MQAAVKGPKGNVKWQNRSFATAEKKLQTVTKDIYLAILAHHLSTLPKLAPVAS